jgi:hypothetical protein
MVSETVLLEVQNIPFLIPEAFGPNPQELLGARTTVDFLLRNPLTQSESLPVGFPLFLTPFSQHFYPEIWGLRVFVNGVEASTTYVKISSENWAVWDMTFPPGDTMLRVTYDLILHSYADGPAAIAKYVLHTGAAWAGPIGQGDLIVRFPYSAEETFIDPQGTLPGYAVDGFDVRWHFENLEPTEANDLILKFVHPEVWREVARARQAVLTERSAQNYWNLARAYALVFADYDPADYQADVPFYFYSPLLAQTTEAQYLKAIELDPGNKELRKEFAEFVTKWAGSMLPTESVAVLTQVAATPLHAATPFPTRTAPPPSATRPATAIAQASSALEATTTALPQATPTSAATISPTPAPAPARPSASIPTSWLIGGTIVVIAVGLWLALRRPAKA